MINALHHPMFAMIFAAHLAFAADGAAQSSRPQTRFVSIENIRGFSGFFNMSQGTVRIVALVAPSAPDCAARIAALERIFAIVPSKRLRAYVVFVPVAETDTERNALIRSADVTDHRIACFWDPTSAVARSLEPVLDAAAGPTVFLVFDTDAVLRENPDVPRLWMSAADTGDARSFDAGALEAAVLERLDRFEERHGRPAADNQ